MEHTDALIASGIDPEGVLAAASAVLESATPRFIEGLGAPSSVPKGSNDFATDLDLELERTITADLVSRTGIEVHGEEFGGPPVDQGTVWVLDPIDGTMNYSAGLPITGILLGLLHDGYPVAGLTWLPLVDMTLSAVVGGPLIRNGQAARPLGDRELSDSIVAVGAFNTASSGRFPGRYRLEIIDRLSSRTSRLRMLGSTGADMAYTATGFLGGAVCFGHHAWDNAAGAALVLAAGGQVTDLHGAPWHVSSQSMLAGSPRVHDALREVIADCGDPAAYQPTDKK